MIQIAEGLHERKYAAIADQIYQRRGEVKLVLIAGPSAAVRPLHPRESHLVQGFGIESYNH